jgi:hypothetical protein
MVHPSAREDLALEPMKVRVLCRLPGVQETRTAQCNQRMPPGHVGERHVRNLDVRQEAGVESGLVEADESIQVLADRCDVIDRLRDPLRSPPRLWEILWYA